MGILDSLKSAARFVTGGSATVRLDSDPLNFKDPFTIRVSVVVGDVDLQAKGAYLKIEGLESVHLRNVRVGSGDSAHTKDIHESNRTFQAEYVLAEAQILQAGRTYDWSLEVSIPAGAQPVYNGIHAKHGIRAMAGVDVSGNDPDSGWVDLGGGVTPPVPG